jgi:peptidyl-tRNA hydrolase, PTH1 family
VIWLIAGLGNPGRAYTHHRHNAGFMALDALAQGGVWSKKFHSDFTEITREGEKLLLLKPQTFMNRSGQALRAAADFYKIPPAQIIVLHDDLDLPLGKLRIKQGGGHGGHNGLRDIDAHLGPDYWRIRLGIGHPGDKDRVHEYVLSNFAPEERSVMGALLELLVKHLPLFWQKSPAALMSKLTERIENRESRVE